MSFVDEKKVSFREKMTILTRIGYNLLDRGDDNLGQEVLDIVHEIRAATIMGALPPDDLMSALDNLLKDCGVKYAVIGGIALAVHGQVRSTEDIDVLVDRLPSQDRTNDVEYMTRLGFYRAKSHTGNHLVIDHRKYGQVEILPATNTLKKWALDTSSLEDVLGSRVPVVSAAAVMALKVHAMTANPKREAKDGPDILSVWLKSKPKRSDVEKHLSDEEKMNLARIIGN